MKRYGKVISEVALRQSGVTVTTPESFLCTGKVLKELIEPYGRRVQKLREFLHDVKPPLRYDVVPLSDPFGPSVSDAELQCIVVSEETRRGGEAVNRKRAENVSVPTPTAPQTVFR